MVSTTPVQFALANATF